MRLHVCWFLIFWMKICRGEVIDVLEYSRMPKLFTMDHFEDCLIRPGGLYCIVDIHLKPSTSELWKQIKNFSADTLRHYRHDILHRGVCVKTRCGESSERSMRFRKNEEEVRDTLSECLNAELRRDYGLEGNISIDYCEHDTSRNLNFDEKDWSFTVAVIILIGANFIGTIYHFRFMKIQDKDENKIFMSFSLISNWRKLMKTTDRPGADERKKSLKGIQGMRFLTMVGVVFTHVVLIIPHGFVRNTLRIETPYSDPLMQLIYNGSFVIQTFFCMASFLMSYHFLIYIEKHPKPTIRAYFLMIAQRWLRLTPMYALILGFISTLGEKMGSGPQWRHVVIKEAEACRRNWWANLFYINNYVEGGTNCLPQAWYLAADTQLYCYGALVMMVIWRFPRIKKLLLIALSIMSMLLPGILTYKNEYHPSVPQSPESFRALYTNDPTFLKMYISMQGNVSGYTVGLIAGCLHYYLEQNKISLKNKKWFRIWYSVFLVPLGVASVMSGAIFYSDSYVYNPLFAAVYAALGRIVFASIIASFLIGIIHKCDAFMRGCVEWSGFQILGRLTYCAFLVHTIPQRVFVGLIKQPFDVIEYNVLSMFIASLSLTYFVSWILCLTVEMPICNLQKLIFESEKKPKEEEVPKSISESTVEEGVVESSRF